MLSYIEDTHLISAAEAAYTDVLLAAWGSEGQKVYTGGGAATYSTTRGRAIPWKIHAMSAHVVTAAGILIPSVYVVLFAQLGQAQLGFFRLAHGWQGVGDYVRFQGEARTDWGVAVAVVQPSLGYVVAGSYLITRVVYEVTR
jgi:hypothetical protein